MSRYKTKGKKMQSETADFTLGAATWRTGRNIRVVFDSDLFPPLYGNMTSSTKGEIHNTSHCRQRTTEPRPQVTCTENLVKFVPVFLDISADNKIQQFKQTDKHTDTLITILRTVPGVKQKYKQLSCCRGTARRSVSFGNLVY